MEHPLPPVESFFPFWNKLPEEYRQILLNNTQSRLFPKGEIIMPYADQCLGLLLVQKGRFRAFVISDKGKEVTLYRLYDYDICLFTASCIMNNIQFEIEIEAEKDTQVLLIPAKIYNRLMERSLEISNYTNQLISARFSDVMWTLEQILFKNMDSRIARRLLDQAQGDETATLTLTHEAIARDLGTAREVVTRMLKYFRSEKMIELSRGKIQLLNIERLTALAE